jgi:hypothetical protein
MIRMIIALALLAAQADAGHCVAIRTGNVRGSGVVVHYSQKADIYVVFTARHVVEGARQAQVSTFDGWVTGNVFAADGVDFAFIEIRVKTPLKPFKLSEHDPEVGETVSFEGFAYGDDWIEGTQEAVVKQAGLASEAKYPPYKGQSGGCVLNCCGQVVGIVSAVSKNTIHYAPISQIKAACQRRWKIWWGGGICPPGGCPPALPPAPLYPVPGPEQGPAPEDTEPTPIQPPKPEVEPVDPTPLPDAPPPATKAELGEVKNLLTLLVVELAKLKDIETPVRVRRQSDKSVISEEKVKLLRGEAINLDLDGKTIEELKKLLGK